MNERLKAVEAEMRALLNSSRVITDSATTEKRSITAEEETQLEGLMAGLAGLKAERKSLLEAGAEADQARAQINGARGTGWKAIAESFVKARLDGRRDHVLETRLMQITGKGAEVDDLTDAAKRTEPGIRELLEDARKFSSLIPSSDPGSALHLEHFSIDARGLASGSSYGEESGTNSVERDPLSTDAKAEADVSVTVDEVDLRQFALLSGAIPNAAFRSVGALRGIVEAALGRELDIALDGHAIAALEASTPSTVSAGSSTVEKLRHAKKDLVAAGVSGPYIAVIGDADAATIDLTVAEDMPAAYPFGLQIAVMPGFSAGQGYVMAQNAMTLHKGAARLDADPFSGFNTNETTLRMEYEALAVVNEPSAIISLT